MTTPTLPAAVKAAKDLLDWAESIICNGVPMPHCKQEEWDAFVKKWRDDKHALFPDGAPHFPQSPTPDAARLAAEAVLDRLNIATNADAVRVAMECDKEQYDAARQTQPPMKSQRITETCQPVFPCWLWHTGNHLISEQWLHSSELIKVWAVSPYTTHFHPDQPDAPPEGPEDEPQSFGAYERSQAITEEMNQATPSPQVPDNLTEAQQWADDELTKEGELPLPPRKPQVPTPRTAFGVGHDLDLERIATDGLCVCKRCRGGEIELVEDCAVKLKRALAEARAEQSEAEKWNQTHIDECNQLRAEVIRLNNLLSTNPSGTQTNKTNE